MKKILTAIFIAVSCFLLTVPAYAYEDGAYVVDKADLLTSSEEEKLEEEFREISDGKIFDVVVVTVDSLEGKGVTPYADDYYDQNGYRDDGILLLVSMEEREWALSTKGKGLSVFGGRELDLLEDGFLPDLSAGDYYSAFSRYGNLCLSCLEGKTGSEASGFKVKWLLIGFGIGAILAFIITGVMRSKLKSVRRQNNATQYVKEGSMNIRDSRDIFLYANVTKRPKPQSNGNGSHRSSSGSFHGGSRGKF